MNPWITFLQENAGKGMSREQLKTLYQSQKAQGAKKSNAQATAKPLAKKSGLRGKCSTNIDCETGLICSEKKRCKGAPPKPTVVKKVSPPKPPTAVVKKASSPKQPTAAVKKASPPKQPTVAAKKEITLTNLLSEFKQKLPNNKIMIAKFTPFSTSILDITVHEHAKFFGLQGKHLKFLREIIPRNTTGRGFQKPLYNVKHGYMYFINDTNRRNLSQFYIVAKELNELYKGYTLISDEAGPQNKTVGVIGWDVKYDEPQWLKDALPGKWDARLNPIIDDKGIMYFQKCAFTGKAYENGLKRIQKLPLAKNLYPKYINIQNSFDELDRFVKSQQTAGYIAWARHARTIFKKSPTELVIIDPWQQNVANQKKFKELATHLTPMNIRVSFLKKAAEQGAEGSCAVHAFARALMIAASPESAANKLDYGYAILASRLLSLGRRGR